MAEFTNQGAALGRQGSGQLPEKKNVWDGVGNFFQKMLKIEVEENSSLTETLTNQVVDKVAVLMSPLSPGRTQKEFDMAYITPRLLAIGRPWSKPSSKAKNRNNSDRLGEYLIHQHSGRFLLWNLSGQKLDPEDSKKLTDQVLDPEWNSPGDKTNIPCVDNVLKICYSIQAWYDVDKDAAIAGVFCSNGVTRTGMLIACYLRYSNRVDTSMEGFEAFCNKRMKENQAPDFDSLPSSLVNFFHNFDVAMELLYFPNPKPISLRGIAIHGVPVEDLPVMDVWNSKTHVYSSINAEDKSKEWLNEEGFYKVNQSLHGDFVVICRFGGEESQVYSEDGKLFRYINSTLFLDEGVLELQKKKVDIMPAYKDNFDDDEFQLTLMFSGADADETSRTPIATVAPDLEILPPFSLEASRKGLLEICQCHTLNPELRQLDMLLEKGYPLEVSTLALQLSCNELEEALDFLSAMMSLLPSNSSEDEPTSLMQPTSSPSPGRAATEKFDLGFGAYQSTPEIVPPRRKRSYVCAHCGENGVIDRPQLLTCTACMAPNHTFCVGEKNIPFSLNNNKEKKHHESYLKRHYQFWKCPLCREEGEGPTLPKDQSLQTSHSPNAHSRDLAGAHLVHADTLALLLGSDTSLVATPPVRHTIHAPSSARGGREVANPFLSPGQGELPRTASTNDLVTPGSPPFTPRAEISSDEQLDLDIVNVVKELKDAGIGMQELLKFKSMKQSPGALVNPFLDPEENAQSKDAAFDTASGATATDPKNAMLAAIKARAPAVESADPKNAMLAAIKARAPAVESADPKNAMLAAIKARAPPADESSDPKSAMLAAIKVRAAPADDSSASDPKSAMLAAIKARAALADDSPAEPAVCASEALLQSYDSKYHPFFKMMKMGVPIGAVKAKMSSQEIECDQRLEADLIKFKEHINEEKTKAENEGDQNKPSEAPSSGVLLKDDPIYAQYFKMLKLNVPKEAVQMKMKINGHDPAVLDMDPEKPLPSSNADQSQQKVALKDHPVYSKYFKMLKVGLPLDAVKNKAKQDSVDVTILDKDPEEMVPLNFEAEKPQAGSAAQKMIALKDHPKYEKYFKMLKVGLPPPAVKQKMTQEGVDPSMLDKDPSMEIPENDDAPTNKAQSPKQSNMVKAEEHPQYSKFFKMLKVGLPLGAVQQKIKQEGLDPSIIEGKGDAMIPLDSADSKAADAGEMVVLKDHPTYEKFFKMLKVGLPKPAVKHKMTTEGVDPEMLEKDPDSLVPLHEKKSKVASAASEPKVKIRRKKLYWQEVPLDNNNIQGSVWQETGQLLDQIVFDKAEFNKLFVSEMTAEEEKKLQNKTAKKEVKESEVLDHKRATNTGIAIARIKMSYEQMSEAITNLNSGVFTAAQLQSLPEYLPTNEEASKLKAYQGDPSKLGEAEKFMLEMLKVNQAPRRFQAMIYKKTFTSRKGELQDTVRVLEAACDDVKMSFKLKKLLGIILKLGNEMNQEKAVGFSFDSLLKLNQGKAFDQRTSILHYLIRLCKKNDPSLLTFQDDLKHIFPASRILLETINAELNELKTGLDLVKSFRDSLPKPATSETGEKQSLTLPELKEQASLPKVKEGVVHFSEFDVANLKERADPGEPEESHSLDTFVLRADYKVCKLKGLIDEVTEKFQSVVKYFGQNSNSPNEFFSTLHSFCKAFDATLEQIRKEEAKKLREERAQTEKQKAQMSRSKSEKLPASTWKPTRSKASGMETIESEKEVPDAEQSTKGADVFRSSSARTEGVGGGIVADARSAVNSPAPKITANALQEMLKKKAGLSDDSKKPTAAPKISADALQAMLQKRAANNA